MNQALRNQLTTAIQETQFYCIDMRLYLDSHPNDAKVQSEFNRFCKQLDDLKTRYDLEFAPLLGGGFSYSDGCWVC